MLLRVTLLSQVSNRQFGQQAPCSAGGASGGQNYLCKSLGPGRSTQHSLRSPLPSAPTSRSHGFGSKDTTTLGQEGDEVQREVEIHPQGLPLRAVSSGISGICPHPVAECTKRQIDLSGPKEQSALSRPSTPQVFTLAPRDPTKSTGGLEIPRNWPNTKRTEAKLSSEKAEPSRSRVDQRVRSENGEANSLRSMAAGDPSKPGHFKHCCKMCIMRKPGTNFPDIFATRSFDSVFPRAYGQALLPTARLQVGFVRAPPQSNSSGQAWQLCHPHP